MATNEELMAEIRGLRAQMSTVEKQGAAHKTTLKEGNKKFDQLFKTVHGDGADNSDALVPTVAVMKNDIASHGRILSHWREAALGLVLAIVGSVAALVMVS